MLNILSLVRGFFVTGTDTGIGKSVVSAALMQHLRQFSPVLYWKPIATGFPADDDDATVRRLGRCGDDELHRFGFRFREPVSPHLAARLEGKRITTRDIRQLRQYAREDATWVVEGAGGVRVPINEDHLMTDVILALELPAIVVARSTLGTINHTLLTLEALRHRLIDVVGVVMVGERNPENRAAIEHYGKIDVLGELPMLDPLDPELLGVWATESLDRGGLLQRRVRRWMIEAATR